ncbi:ankyrin and HET domain protein [Apiospora saccharicola]|uniref:Ankyrin and HET domain protein n=1 Tax=Apiospora saccharicola TaxID=335842 RepID=A0ABR1UEP0_9PEZI
MALGDVVRDGQQVPMRTANDEDVQQVKEFLQAGEEEEGQLEGSIRDTVRDVLLNQRVFVTASGLMGCGHLDTQAGDRVWVFRGGRVPFIVRPRDDGSGVKEEADQYTLVGECYVQGIMQGEGVRGDIFGVERPVERQMELY